MYVKIFNSKYLKGFIMGLDCTAYSNLRQLHVEEIQFPEHKEKNETIFYLNEDYPNSAKDILPDVVYLYDKKESWKSGSYGSYNQWRDWLATLGGWKSTDHACQKGNWGDPFFELINFSDCEGTLGTNVCKKLLKNFIDFQHKADALSSEYNYYKKLYNQWRFAFEVASDNGAISFH